MGASPRCGPHAGGDKDEAEVWVRAPGRYLAAAMLCAVAPVDHAAPPHAKVNCFFVFFGARAVLTCFFLFLSLYLFAGS